MKEKWFVYRHAEPSGQKESTLFRRCFAYDGSKNVIANITADTRYRLFVNGHYVCRGPESGDAYRKYYDTIDISPWLRQGENCIGVQVLHYAMGDDGIKRFAFGPTALAPSLYGGLCVFSENDAADFDTRGGWKYHNDDGHSFTAPRMAKYAGDMERVNFTKRPLGWMLPDFDDSGWPDAVPVQQAGEGDGAMEYGILRNWNLHRRDIPMMRQTPISPAAVYGQTPGVRFDGILTGEPVTVPAGTGGRLRDRYGSDGHGLCPQRISSVRRKGGIHLLRVLLSGRRQTASQRPARPARRRRPDRAKRMR